MSAISSAVHLFLGIFGIALLFLFSRFPGGNQVVVFALGIVPDFEDHGTQPATAPSDGTELFRIVALLVHNVHLVEYFLRLFQADAMFTFDIPALLAVEIKAHIRYITVIPSATLHGTATLPLFDRLRSEEHTSELQSRQYLVC